MNLSSMKMSYPTMWKQGVETVGTRLIALGRRHSRRGFGRTFRVGSVFAIVTSCFGQMVSPIGGQVVFSSKTRPVDYPGYSSVWECLAAVQRVRDSIAAERVVWPDTLPIGLVQPDSIASTVSHVARSCRANATERELRKDVRPWVTLMLLRNADSGLPDVVKAYEPVFSDDSVRNDVISIVAEIYMRDRALNLPEPESWRQYLIEQTRAPEKKAGLWYTYMWAARARRDTQHIEIGYREITSLGLDTTADDGNNRRLLQSAAAMTFFSRRLLDSLRVGGSAGYLRAYATASEHEKTLLARGDLIGMQAPLIKPAVWTSPPPDGQFPPDGKATMLVFIDNQSYTDPNGITPTEPFGAFAALRRIEAKFPQLNVVFITRALGWFGVGPPLTPAEEGAAIKKWLFDHHHLRGGIAVDSTPFYRMPDPDRRRVNRSSEMDLDYRLGIALRFGPGNTDRLRRGPLVMLISADRRIVDYSEINNTNEPQFITFIEVLLKENTR